MTVAQTLLVSCRTTGRGRSDWLFTMGWKHAHYGAHRISGTQHVHTQLPPRQLLSDSLTSVTSEFFFCDLKKCLVCIFARGSVIISLLWSFEYIDSTYNPKFSGFNILKHPRNVKCYKLVSPGKKKKIFLSFKGFPFPWLRPFPSGFCIMNISRGWLTTVSSETHLSKPRMCAMQRKKKSHWKGTKNFSPNNRSSHFCILGHVPVHAARRQNGHLQNMKCI